MASAKILMAQKQLNKQEKLRVQKQKQRRVSASRRSSLKAATVVPQAHKNDFSNRVMRRCFRARMFANAH